MSTLRKFQVLLALAITAAPAGLITTWYVPPRWSNISAMAGLFVTLLCVIVMALLRCPKCQKQLGLSEAAREFHSHCCPHCGVDLRG